MPQLPRGRAGESTPGPTGSAGPAGRWSAEPGSWTRRRATVALLAITLFALVVRLVGVDFLLPHVWEPDQRVYTTQVELLRRGEAHPERNVNFGWYPLLPAYAVTCLPRAQATTTPSTIDEHLDAAKARRLEIRRVLATLSVLLVPATYWIARRFGRRETALLAALLSAASVFHIWYGQQTRPHGLATATTALALVGALAVRRRGDAPAYLLAGGLLGVAVAVLQSGLAVLPALLVAHVLCARGRFLVRTGWLVLGLALTFAAVRLAYPYVFQDSAGRGKDAAQFGLEEDGFNLSGHRVDFAHFGVRGFRVLTEAWWDYDLGLLVLAALGAATAGWLTWKSIRAAAPGERVRALAHAHPDLLVVLAFALPYAAVFGTYGLTYPRFSLAFLPLFAVLAARFVLEVNHRRWARTAGLAVCALQVVLAVRLSIIRTEPDTASLAAVWLGSHVDRERDRIALQPGLDLPLFRDEAARESARHHIGMHIYPWLNYQDEAARKGPLEPAWSLRNLPLLRPESSATFDADPRAWLRSQAADWFVIARGLEGTSEGLNRANTAIRAHCELVARFTPLAFDSGDETPFVFQNDFQPEKSSVFTRLPIALRMGPVVEVWRAPRDPGPR